MAIQRGELPQTHGELTTDQSVGKKFPTNKKNIELQKNIVLASSKNPKVYKR